jgi:glycosyltransferase involved in cell wall biosynthesis
MKILIISHEASLTGAPKVAFSLARALKRKGHSIYWLFGKGGILFEELSTEDYSIWMPDLSKSSLVKRIFFNLRRGLSGYHLKIKNDIKKAKFDLIINNTVMNGEILENLGINDIPVVSIVHEMETVLLWAESMQASTSKTLKKSNYLIAVSEPVKQDIIRLFNIDPNLISIIPGYADIDTSVIAPPKDSFIVGGCGSLIQRKGVDQFLSAARMIKETNPNLNIKFQWVGGTPGSLAFFEVMSDIRKMNLEDTVSINGQTKQPERYFAGFDVFFMSSREDPFPLVNLEVAQFGVPMICFKGSGGSEHFAEMGGGIAVPYLRTNEVSDLIIRFYEDSEFSINQKNSALKAGRQFTKDLIEPKWVNFIEQIRC